MLLQKCPESCAEKGWLTFLITNKMGKFIFLLILSRITMAVEWKNYSGRYKQVCGAFVQSWKLFMCLLYHKGASVRKTRNADWNWFFTTFQLYFKYKIFKVATHYIDGIFPGMLLQLSLEASHISVCLCKLYQYWCRACCFHSLSLLTGLWGLWGLLKLPNRRKKYGNGISASCSWCVQVKHL